MPRVLAVSMERRNQWKQIRLKSSWIIVTTAVERIGVNSFATFFRIYTFQNNNNRVRAFLAFKLAFLFAFNPNNG
jgi:hypothetical protein